MSHLLYDGEFEEEEVMREDNYSPYTAVLLKDADWAIYNEIMVRTICDKYKIFVERVLYTLQDPTELEGVPVVERLEDTFEIGTLGYLYKK